MDDNDFQDELRGLQRRVSELSLTHPMASRVPMHDSFSAQVDDLKLCLAKMQDRLSNLDIPRAPMAPPPSRLITAPSEQIMSAPSTSAGFFESRLDSGLEVFAAPEHLLAGNEVMTEGMRKLDGSVSEHSGRSSQELHQVLTPPSSAASFHFPTTLTGYRAANDSIFEGGRECLQDNVGGALGSLPYPLCTAQSPPAQRPNMDQAWSGRLQGNPSRTNCQMLRLEQLTRRLELHAGTYQADKGSFNRAVSDMHELRYTQSLMDKKLKTLEKDNELLTTAVLNLQRTRYSPVLSQAWCSKQVCDRSGHYAGREGLAFRDLEISRLDEQVKLAHENLKASEETVADKTNLCETLRLQIDEKTAEARRNGQRCSDLEERLEYYRHDSKGKDLEMNKMYDDVQTWKQRSERAEHALERYSKQVEDFRRQQDVQSEEYYSLLAQKSHDDVALKQVTATHEFDMGELQAICERKVAVISKQHRVIRRAEKMLEDKDKEIDRLRYELAVVERDREDAMRAMRKTARLLDERELERNDSRRAPVSVVDGRGDHTWSLGGEHNLCFEAREDSSSQHEQPERPSYRHDSRQDAEPSTDSRSPSPRPSQDGRSSCRPSTPERMHPNSDAGTSDSGRGCYERRWRRVYDSTLRPPLPAPSPFGIRRMMSEASLVKRTSSSKQRRRDGIAKHQSMQELSRGRQPYVETEAESEGNLF